MYTVDYIPEPGAKDIIPEEDLDGEDLKTATPTKDTSTRQPNQSTDVGKSSKETTPKETTPREQKPATNTQTNPPKNDTLETLESERVGVYTNPQALIIRGTAFDLQSIAYLSYVLKAEDYVKDVKLSPIENYDDGNHQHKIFEIVVILGGGRQ
jgi:hypothetical protein